MKESFPSALSRRDFLTVGWSRRQTSASEQEKNSGFRVVVSQPDQLPEDLPGIIFSNWIDFPSPPKPRPANVMTVSHEKGRKNFSQEALREDCFLSPILVEPISPIQTTQEEKVLELVALAGEWWLPLIPVVQGSWALFKAGDVPEMPRRRFLYFLGGLLAGFGVSKLGLTRLAARQENSSDVLASEFSMKAKVSSMRAMIIMEDAWKLHREQVCQEPVLAISESKADALELFADQDPERLKTQLLSLPEYHGTLVESTREAGSVEQLFTYNITDLYYGVTNSITLRDGVFLQNLKRVVSLYLPEPLREGEWCA